MHDSENLQQRLVWWSDVFETSLQSQAPLLDVLNQQLTVEYQTLTGDVLATGLRAKLQDAVLDRSDQAWRAEADGKVHEWIEIVIESVDSRLVEAYEDYLLRHWQARPADLVEAAAYDKRITLLLHAHLQSLRDLRSNNRGGALLTAISSFQDAWRNTSAMEAFASPE